MVLMDDANSRSCVLKVDDKRSVFLTGDIEVEKECQSVPILIT